MNRYVNFVWLLSWLVFVARSYIFCLSAEKLETNKLNIPQTSDPLKNISEHFFVKFHNIFSFQFMDYWKGINALWQTPSVGSSEPGVSQHPLILTDQLPLSQPGGPVMTTTTCTLSPPPNHQTFLRPCPFPYFRIWQYAKWQLTRRHMLLVRVDGSKISREIKAV